MKITILGCGLSPGVPLVGDYWGACDPTNIKNRRTRASILIEHLGYRILIDSSPDLRQQLLRENIDWVDACLYTHEHADHTHGINDLFCLGRFKKKSIPIYADKSTLEELLRSFGYAFDTGADHHGNYDTPRLIPHTINGPQVEPLPGLVFEHFEQDHGFSKSYGYRIGDFAFCTDLIGMPDKSWQRLEGVKTLVADCLCLKPHPTHAHLDLTLSWMERLNVERGYLTHLGAQIDYETLLKQLPSNVKPCYDGLVINI